MKTPILKWGMLIPVLCLMSVLFWQCSDGEAGAVSNNLFEQYYEAYPAPTPVRAGGADEERETWNRAAENYGSGDYIGAIEGFKQALANQRPPDADVNFYLGVSHLELTPARPKEAIEFFNAVIDERKGKYYEAARWYRALSYLNWGKVQESKIMLERIKQEEDEFKKGEVIKLLTNFPAE